MSVSVPTAVEFEALQGQVLELQTQVQGLIHERETVVPAVDQLRKQMAGMQARMIQVETAVKAVAARVEELTQATNTAIQNHAEALKALQESVGG